MTRLEDLTFDTLANALLKSLVGKAPKRLIRALWSLDGIFRCCACGGVLNEQ